MLKSFSLVFICFLALSFGSFLKVPKDGNFPNNGAVHSSLPYRSSHWPQETIIIGGSYQNIGNLTGFSTISSYNGSNWNQIVEEFGYSGTVFCLIPNSTYGYYAAGNFSWTYQAQTYNNIAYFDYSTKNWTSFAEIDGPIYYGYISGEDESLYICGDFHSSQGTILGNVAYWKNNKWNSLGSNSSVGTDGPVYQIVSYNSTYLCFGGKFSHAGGIEVSNIAWYNIQTGQYVALPPISDEVRAMIVVNGRLFVGGKFVDQTNSNISHVAVYFNETWRPLGSGLNDDVYCFLLKDDLLYVGGKFTSEGVSLLSSNKTIRYVAIWDLTQRVWKSAFEDIYYPSSTNEGSVVVYSLNWWKDYRLERTSYDNLIIGGQWQTFYYYEASNLVIYRKSLLIDESSDWKPLLNYSGDFSYYDNGVGGSVHDLSYYGGKLWIGGSFSSCGLLDTSYLCAWDEKINNFTSVATSIDGNVNIFVKNKTELIIGGGFTLVGDVPVDGIVIYNGSTFRSLYGDQDVLGLNDDVRALAINDDGSVLYAAGSFTKIGQEDLKYVAKFDVKTLKWQALSDTTDSSYYYINTLYWYDGALWVGGNFYVQLNNKYVSDFLKYDGSKFIAPYVASSSDSSSGVYTIVGGYDSYLYLGGSFDTLGGVRVKNIAKYNGSSFDVLGSGTNEQVTRCGWFSEQSLVCVGDFTVAGRANANSVARFENGTWYKIGSGISSYGQSLYFTDKYLYIAGSFSQCYPSSSSSGSSTDKLYCYNIARIPLKPANISYYSSQTTSQPTTQIVPTQTTSQPTTQSVPTQTTSQPTTQTVPTQTTSQPTTQTVPTETTSQPTTQTVPTQTTSQPTTQTVPSQTTSQPTTQTVPTETTSQPTTQTVPSQTTSQPTTEIPY